jgi:hypothetical protein
MPTKPQIQIVQIARRQVGLNNPQYRMLLANVAGVKSTTELNNTQVEDVMDVLEGMGFVDSKHGAGYWGGKVQRRSQVANERMTRKIEAMAAETKYPLGALARRFSNKRTDQVHQLLPREAWMLIEALKDIVEREKLTTAVPAMMTTDQVKSVEAWDRKAAEDCHF